MPDVEYDKYLQIHNAYLYSRAMERGSEWYNMDHMASR